MNELLLSETLGADTTTQLYRDAEGGYRVRVMELPEGGGEKLAGEMGIPFLGRIPLDPRLSECSDEGLPFVYKYPDSPAALDLSKVVDRIEAELGY